MLLVALQLRISRHAMLSGAYLHGTKHLERVSGLSLLAGCTQKASAVLITLPCAALCCKQDGDTDADTHVFFSILPCQNAYIQPNAIPPSTCCSMRMHACSYEPADSVRQHHTCCLLLMLHKPTTLSATCLKKCCDSQYALSLGYRCSCLLVRSTCAMP